MIFLIIVNITMLIINILSTKLYKKYSLFKIKILIKLNLLNILRENI